MVERILQRRARQLLRRHPVVTLMGPRQSGKTTLCRAAFASKPYVSLEPPDEREFARTDPRGFLARFPSGAVIDEVQRVPELLSYIQQRVDDRPTPGAFVLTGSQNLGLIQAVTQTLAGRTALLQLLPLSLDEIRRFPKPPRDLAHVLWRGGYPRVYDRKLPASEWLAGYAATYVERDVRQLLRVGDLLAFQTFLRMSAGRAGQLLNLSALGADCGVTHATARSWMSVLEASYVAFRIPPFHRNLGKRLIKTPKLYFYDTGLLCYLIGIREPSQLEQHPLRGPIFENWVVTEVLKHWTHRGETPALSFYRDRKGAEIDLIVDRGSDLVTVEIKSSRTPPADALRVLTLLSGALGPSAGTTTPQPLVVFAGEHSQRRTAGEIRSWGDLHEFPWIRGTRRGRG